MQPLDNVSSEVLVDPTITVTVEDPTDPDHEIFIATLTGGTISWLIDRPRERRASCSANS